MPNPTNPVPKLSVLALQGKAEILKAAAVPLIAPLTAPETPAGSTAHFTFAFDPSVATGQALATAAAQTCERDFAVMQRYFGLTPNNLPFAVTIVPGGNGASHGSCLDTHIRADAFDGTTGATAGRLSWRGTSPAAAIRICSFMIHRPG